MSWDYYGEEGCCLTCEEQEEDCLCFNCKCRKCEWYEPLYGADWGEKTGECTYPRKPPVGYVLMTDDPKEVVKIKPYLSPDKFKRVVELLKEFRFYYNKAKKKWYRRASSKGHATFLAYFLPLSLLEKKIKALEVKVRRKDHELLF